MNFPFTTSTCCKVNLGLNIVGKRPDGYHNLQTIFYPVPLFDELTFSLGLGADVLTLGGRPLEGDVRDNLVLRAVRLLRDEGFAVPPLSISLRKVIPSGAGLGGGSSDAACTIRTVLQNLGFSVPLERQQQLASKLGADCPFFIEAAPVYAEGIGDVFTPIPLSLNGWWLMLVKPDVFVSTREAYAGVRPSEPRFSLSETVQLPVEEWRERMTNDFEESVFAKHTLLAEIKDELYRRGAVYASMSGSGSTIFGLFRQKPICEEAFAEHFCQVLAL